MSSSSRIRRRLLAAALASVALFGACDGGDAASEPSAVRLALSEPIGDVVAVLYVVECDGEAPWTAYVPLSDDPGLPEHLSPDNAGAPFADLFFLTSATSCDIDAQPMASPTAPSVDCQPTDTTLAVAPGAVSEAVLIISCASATGGVDVATLINRAPDIEKLTVTPATTVDPCVEVRVAPTVSDPDGDTLVLSFALLTPPGAQVVKQAATASEFSFTPATPGSYQVVVTAQDPWTRTEIALEVTVNAGDAPCSAAP